MNGKKVFSLGQLLQKIVPKIGAKVVIEPKYGAVGQIIFKNSRKRYFRGNTLDLNPAGASAVAKDKDYANFFLKKLGYPTVPGKAFFSDSWCKTIGSSLNIKAAYNYARKIGFPLIVKPNSGSQGTGVFKVINKREFYQALRLIFKQDNIALVQKIVLGKDYRLVVLDNKIISAYQRIPLNIVGGGGSTVATLLQKKLKHFALLGRDIRQIKKNDIRFRQNLARQGLNMKSVLPAGRRIFLLNNANLSSGGDAIDVTNRIHPDFKKIARQLTKDMGLRLGGVDFMIQGDIGAKPKKYWIIEINCSPGLDHYVKTGRAQEKIVENMYLAVLKAMQD